jgi:poly-gamma-glutamate synthesis protein (capsule biosynthesis protein)
VEIYRNRPVFYGLGNFILNLENMPFFPHQMYERFDLGFEATPSDYLDAFQGKGTRHFSADPIYWRTVVPLCQWEGSQLKEVQLWPVDLGYGKHWGARGRPMLAEAEVAEQIISYLQRVSQPLGCQIQTENGRGAIRLPT